MFDNELYIQVKRHPKRVELDKKWRNHEISHREYARRDRILR